MERDGMKSRVRELAMIAGPALLVCLGAVWLAFQFVEPAPPKVVKMTTGSETGGYFKFGQRYAELMKAQGIKLEIATSAGSIENIKRLNDPATGFKLGLVQGGISNSELSPDLVSIGRVFLEPLWVFHRAADRVERLSDLKGRRLAVGADGSGTRQLAETLLKSNQVTIENSRLAPLSGQNAVDALLESEVDAIFLAFAPEAPLIQQLLRDDRLQLMNFVQSEAYTRLFPYLTHVVLPQGVVDLEKNIPPQDVSLVAAQAALVARKDLHPALAELLVDAATAVHSKGSVFQRLKDYPKGIDPEYPMSEDAERIYKSGQPFFRRFLPFWLANFIERMIVLVVPLATIFIPVFKLVPWLYQWRINQRLLYWYGQLKALEKRTGPGRSAQIMAEHHHEIDRIEEAVSRIPVPLRYSDKLYELRGAIDLVRSRLTSQLAA